MPILNGQEDRINYVSSTGEISPAVEAAKAAYEAAAAAYEAAFAVHKAAKEAYKAAAEREGYEKHRTCANAACRKMIPLAESYRGKCIPCAKRTWGRILR